MSAVPKPLRQIPLDLRTAVNMLQYVDGCDDRQVWLAIGMALKSEFGGDAYDAWEDWSNNAPNFSAKACKASWRGFKSGNGGYTIGTLIKLAKDGGYQADPAHKPDLAEVTRRRAERQERNRVEAAQRQAANASAADRAWAQWRAAKSDGTSAYLQRKGVDGAESIRYTDSGAILVPMIRYDLAREYALKGVQTIQADGVKKFTYGTDKAGTACRLGLAQVGQPVFLCEGYVTGMSIRMALERRYPVFVAFDAYNLPLVAEYIYRTLPTCPMVICGDDDWKTSVGGQPHNTGRIQGQVAMDSVMDAGAKLVVRTVPVFRKDTPRADKDSDFNDLHRLEGLAEVKTQLELCLEAIETLRSYG